jgi:hypothetical protein
MNNIFPISQEHIRQKLLELEKARRKELNDKIENITDTDIREVLKELHEKVKCNCNKRMIRHG